MGNKRRLAGRNELGRRAEDAALDFLESRGYRLLERNWRCGHKEIDLIMLGNGFLHIIEVRSLTESGNIPYESINAGKQRDIISAAARYVYEKRICMETKFDVVSVIFRKDKIDVEHYPEAFAPRW